MILHRKGCIYYEWTNDGKHPVRNGLSDPAKPSKKFRWVGTINVDGKRYRCRSTNRRSVERWMRDMLIKHPTYEI